MRGIHRPRAVRHARNIADLAYIAARNLPSPVRHYLEGGADDELTLARNTQAFNRWGLIPRALADVSSVDTRTELFGVSLSMPLVLSPTGMSRLFHRHGEMAVARAARKEGLLYGLSTMGTTTMEAVATTQVQRFFQLYVFRDRGLTSALLQRAAAAGYLGLCLTVDTPLAGNRERDLVTGMSIPPRFGWRSLLSFAAHPRWSCRMMNRDSFEIPNVVQHVGALPKGGTGIIDYINRQFDRSVTWKDVEWLRSQWNGSLLIKGLVEPQDCMLAASLGCDAVTISNHGGRQLDGTAGAIERLLAIRDQVQDRLRLILDGGVRRGTHVLKALALGADACSIGRPYIYGLAAGGEAGVLRAIQLLRAEIERDLALMGKSHIAQITRADIECLAEIHPPPAAGVERRTAAADVLAHC